MHVRELTCEIQSTNMDGRRIPSQPRRCRTVQDEAMGGSLDMCVDEDDDDGGGRDDDIETADTIIRTREESIATECE